MVEPAKIEWKPHLALNTIVHRPDNFEFIRKLKMICFREIILTDPKSVKIYDSGIPAHLKKEETGQKGRSQKKIKYKQ